MKIDTDEIVEVVGSRSLANYGERHEIYQKKECQNGGSCHE